MSATRIATKAQLILVCSAALIAATIFTAYHAMRRHLDALAWVTHTVEVRRTLAETLAAAESVEAGGRGYLLTRQLASLETYDGGRLRVRRLIGDLQRLTGDNPDQQRQLYDFEAAWNRKLAQTAAMVAAAGQGEQESARRSLDSGDNKAAMDRVRGGLAVLEAEEVRLLGLRREAARRTQRMASLALLGATALGLTLVLTFMLGLRRDAGRLAVTTNRLVASEEKFRLLADHATDLVILQDKDGNAEYVSPSSHRLLGFSPEEIIRGKVPSFVHEADRKLLDRYAEDIMDSRDPSAAVRFRMRTKKGQHRWFESRTFIAEDRQTGRVLFQTTARDVNDQVVAEQALARSREVYRTLVQNLPKMSVALYDDQLRYQFIDGPLLEAMGTTKAAIEGKRVLDVTPAEDRMMTEQMYRAALRGRVVEMETMIGQQVYNVVLSPLAVEGVEAMGLAVMRDVTDERRLEDLLARQAEELRSLSLRDELTGLNNRRGFVTLATQQLKVAARMQRPIAVLFVDLNGMKPINDTLGHQAGDDALKDTGTILRTTFRESDIVSRLGGDEFAVLVNDVRPDDMRFVLARLEAGVERHNQTAQRPYRVSISIGVVHHAPGTVAAVEDLLAEADRRMYEDKRARKQERGRLAAVS
jgi:diguanylate cyclase (GGDEF)-like protein/PAS domain S-box-containing protein